MSDQLLYQIGLTLIPGIGDVLGKSLVAYCGGPEAVFQETKKSLEKIPGIGMTAAANIRSVNVLDRAEQEIKFLEQNNIQPLFYLDKNYPKRLQQYMDSPLMLYYKGNADLNAPRAIAIVGTRNITEYGKGICEKFVDDLSDDNVLIVSGLAYGVDTAAHRAAVKNNIATVGVLGHGLQQIYPAINKKLASQMFENGGLLTECISGTIPDRENFPKRNRIIAGMVDAVVVVESALKGGSLITADIANSYNKDVFAFPGKINDIYSQGCNYLIRSNRANLIENVGNLRYIMRWDTPEKKETQTQLFREFSEEEQQVLNAFGNEHLIDLDSLIVKTDLPTTKLASLLLTLEFDGILVALPGKRYQRV